MSNIFIHDTAVVDKNVKIGDSTAVWHFSHIEENANIGSYCVLGQNVNIGNNVKIGGGSGVINDISDNRQVMGYPAIPLREFVKQRKK